MAMKKENIQCNTTKETLFVGVGGVGSDIVRRVASKCRGNEGDNIRFVVMDTNANDLRSVKNSGANVITVQTSSTQSVLDYLKNDDEARNHWFPNNTTLYSKTVSEGAGQVRAISRLALNATIKNGNIRELYKAIDELFLKDGGDLKQALRVVIVSSAAGGTGSGISMIVGMLIREYLHKHYREKSAIIRGYLVLPGVMDTVIRTETERESQRRNGYATIKEINAFMIKASGFCGVRKELERYKDLHIDVPTTTEGVDRLEGLPFDFCFLLDQVDKNQESMKTLTQYKEFAAQSLYEQNIGAMEKDAFGVEDNIIKEFANGNNLGRNRFGGIGASVLRYPYEEILEYVAYSRAISCIGSGETVGEWLKYDKAFEKEKAEFKKRRAYTAEGAPTHSAVYIKNVNEGGARFDIDIRGNLANETDKIKAEINAKLLAYKSEFDGQIRKNFESDPKIKNLKCEVDELREERNYEGDEALRGMAEANLTKIRNYENEIKKNAAFSARSAARAILFDAPSMMADSMPYHIEHMLRGNDGATVGLNRQLRVGTEGTPDDLRSIYGVFVNKKAVCAGYAKAMQYLLNRCGIECAYIMSQTHAWNLVKLEGDYYHLDATWGDGSNTQKDKHYTDEVMYGCFCITSEELTRLAEHDPNVPVPKCTATKCNYFRRSGLYFDSYDFTKIRAAILRRVSEGAESVPLKFGSEKAYREALDSLVYGGKISEIYRFVSMETGIKIRSSGQCATDNASRILTFFPIRG